MYKYYIPCINGKPIVSIPDELRENTKEIVYGSDEIKIISDKLVDTMLYDPNVKVINLDTNKEIKTLIGDYLNPGVSDVVIRKDSLNIYALIPDNKNRGYIILDSGLSKDDDNNVFGTAIDFINDIGGGEIFISRGEYFIDSIDISSNTCLRGRRLSSLNGQLNLSGSDIIIDGIELHSNSDAITGSNLDNVVICLNKIYCTVDNNNYSGIKLGSIRNSIIRDNYIYNFGYGVSIDGNVINILSNTIDKSYISGISISNGVFNVKDNIINMVDNSNIASGISYSNSTSGYMNNVRIKDNIIGLDTEKSISAISLTNVSRIGANSEIDNCVYGFNNPGSTVGEFEIVTIKVSPGNTEKAIYNRSILYFGDIIISYSVAAGDTLTFDISYIYQDGSESVASQYTIDNSSGTASISGNKTVSPLPSNSYRTIGLSVSVSSSTGATTSEQIILHNVVLL